MSVKQLWSTANQKKPHDTATTLIRNYKSVINTNIWVNTIHHPKISALCCPINFMLKTSSCSKFLEYGNGTTHRGDISGTGTIAKRGELLVLRGQIISRLGSWLTLLECYPSWELVDGWCFIVNAGFILNTWILWDCLSPSWELTYVPPSKLLLCLSNEDWFGGFPSLATVFDVFDVWGVASQSGFDFEDPKHVTQVLNPTSCQGPYPNAQFYIMNLTATIPPFIFEFLVVVPFMWTFSPSWAQLPFHGPSWAHLPLPGHNFPFMGLHGHIFPFMGTSSGAWPWGPALFDGNLASLGVSLGIAKAVAKDGCMCRHVSVCVTTASHTHAKSLLLLPHVHLTQ